jgi:Asp/Glu/hydantoin racemase
VSVSGNAHGDAVVVCVHATPRAIEPVAAWFSQAPELTCVDLVEPRLFDADAAGDAGRELFLATLQQARRQGPDVILTTCSMYTQHLPALRAGFDVPVLGVDEPLIQRAAAIGGRLALVGALEPAIAFTQRLIKQAAASTPAGARPVTIARTVQVAADAAAPEHREALAAQLRALAAEVDAVVVVQASLSPVARLLNQRENDVILTSPRLALARVRDILKHRSAT